VLIGGGWTASRDAVFGRPAAVRIAGGRADRGTAGVIRSGVVLAFAICTFGMNGTIAGPADAS